MRALIALMVAVSAAAAQPQQPIRVAGTHLETADGKPFLLVADTCWTGAAYSTEPEWAEYLADRKAKGFTAIQFNIVSPWRAAPADAEGRTAYGIDNGKLVINTAFYDRVEARLKSIVDAGLLPVPVLIWAHKKGDAGADLAEDNIVALVNYELDRLGKYPALWILAGDNSYRGAEGQKWQRVGQKVFAGRNLVATTHPTGENFPWAADGWPDQQWLSVISYQSGHGDSAKTLKWLTSGPATTYHGPKPIVNLEPPYEGHNGYSSRKPHSALSTRRATYWSLLRNPPAGVTYGGHGVWSWHTRPGAEPTGHPGTGVAKVWRDALDLPFATQIRVVGETFKQLPWTELRPAQQLVAGQANDPAQFVAVATTPDGSAALVYSPSGAAGLAKLKPQVLAIKPLVLVNPVTGTRTPTTAAALLTDAAKAASVDGDILLAAGGTP